MAERFILRDRVAREAEEAERLAPAAFRSADSRGRERPEPPDPMRTIFERDRDRIMHSKAFRRLKHKTQVFVNPEDDHYVTRLTHTIQVTQIARALAAALSLNEALAEASRARPRRGPLALRTHRRGGALALLPDAAAAGTTPPRACASTRCSRTSTSPGRCATASAPTPGRSTRRRRRRRPCCVRYADRIAYLTHDALDAMRAGMLTGDAVPGRHDRRASGRPARPGSGA